MSDAHEAMEQTERSKEASESNRIIALLIAVLALFLSFSETLGKGAQTEAIGNNVEAADAWAFYQAKTIRKTMLQTAIEQMKLTETALAAGDPAAKSGLQQQYDNWSKTIARFDSDPSTHEGRKELMDRAKELDDERDLHLARYHHYELASAAFQVGIVLASAAVITGMIVLAWLAGLLGLGGLAILGLGFYAPMLLQLP